MLEGIKFGREAVFTVEVHVPTSNNFDIALLSPDNSPFVSIGVPVRYN